MSELCNNCLLVLLITLDIFATGVLVSNQKALAALDQKSVHF